MKGCCASFEGGGLVRLLPCRRVVERGRAPINTSESKGAKSSLAATPFHDTNHNSPVTDGHYGTGRHPQRDNRPHSSFLHSPTSTNFTHESPLSSLLFPRHPFAL